MLSRVHKRRGKRVSNAVYAAYKMYAEGNVTSGIVHVIIRVLIKLASTWKILCLLLVLALAANEKKHEGTKKAQVRRSLNKSSKQSVSAALNKAISSPSSLNQADCGGELLASVLQEMDSQLYIHTFPCRAEFWEKFKVTDLMARICKALGELYCTTYKRCDNGKE